MATSEDDNDSSISRAVWTLFNRDFWPLIIGFALGRAWDELPPTITGKASAIAVDVTTLFLLFFVGVAVVTLSFFVAVWLYQTVA